MNLSIGVKRVADYREEDGEDRERRTERDLFSRPALTRPVGIKSIFALGIEEQRVFKSGSKIERRHLWKSKIEIFKVKFYLYLLVSYIYIYDKRISRIVSRVFPPPSRSECK